VIEICDWEKENVKGKEKKMEARGKGQLYYILMWNQGLRRGDKDPI
jgi:hypothetical protein